MQLIVTVFTDCLDNNGVGEFVKCLDCGEIMLMQIGGTACGNCESENVEWVDENQRRRTIAELESMGYIIEEK